MGVAGVFSLRPPHHWTCEFASGRATDRKRINSLGKQNLPGSEINVRTIIVPKHV